MIHEKIESTKWSAPFVKKGVEVKNGDIVTISDVAEQGANKFDPSKPQKALRIRIDGIGERLINLNQTSTNILIDEFGSRDDAKWVGKKAKILLKPDLKGTQRVYILFLVGLDYELDEWGAPVNPKMEGVQKAQDDDIPEIKPEEEDIRVEDIPF